MTTMTTESTLPSTRHPLRKLPVISGVFALAALAVALFSGHDGPDLPAAILGACSLACLAAELGRRLWQLLRAPEGKLLILAGLGVLVLVMASASLGTTTEALAAVVLGGAGTFLAAMGASRMVAVRRASATPWANLRGLSRHERSGLLLRIFGPLLSGVVLILLALQVQSSRPAVVTMLVVAVLAVAWRARAGERAPTGERKRGQEEVAAHLHDSVLQTLALIQRSAGDPARVAQLARNEERHLRDWLAGRDHDTAATLPGALRTIAAEVEQEIAGATIDLVCVGSAPMDRRVEMLTQAAREAMRNAARHGSPKVRVFCESDDRAMTVFVRDGGSGLNLEEIPSDRRGIRDAIIGRMEHVDGTVSIESGEHGTEIELRLPIRSN